MGGRVRTYLHYSHVFVCTLWYYGAMVWYVYMLEGADQSLYTGITNDIERRLREHNGKEKGGAKYTRSRRPYHLVHTETYPSRSEAARREYAIKLLSRTAKLGLITTRKRDVSRM